MARAIGSGTISFGLVSIPVRLYVATHSEQLHFHMLHEKCGTRVRQHLYCPHCKRTIERSETVRGYEVRKGRYVSFTDEELDALEAEANRAIEIQEFVPLSAVDPIYFEDAHYLGPDRDGGKAYHVLAESMDKAERVAVAQFTHHGKEHLVLIRPYKKGLVLHTMYYADEVRSFDVDTGRQTARPGEITMAQRLIDQLASDTFRPERYKDEYRTRLKAAVQKKLKGREITAAEPEKPTGKVVDLMEALKQSLGGRRARSARRAGSTRRAQGGRRRGTQRRARA